MYKSVYRRLLEAGYPHGEIDHHESDLYVYVTPLTSKIIDEWSKEERLNKQALVSTFRDQTTGRAMYEVTFGYDPYWKPRMEG